MTLRLAAASPICAMLAAVAAGCGADGPQPTAQPPPAEIEITAATPTVAAPTAEERPKREDGAAKSPTAGRGDPADQQLAARCPTGLTKSQCKQLAEGLGAPRDAPRKLECPSELSRTECRELADATRGARRDKPKAHECPAALTREECEQLARAVLGKSG